MSIRTLSITAVVASMSLFAGAAYADDHLFSGATSDGADNRGFANPVAGNPSGTAGAKAQPGTVPGLGDPKVGQDTGTPSFSQEALAERLATIGNGR